jgi:hypothetical protein
MWFGDYVTMAWWDDLWLNESFADWLGDKITQQVYPEYEVELDELGDIQRTMSGDTRPSALAIQRPVTPKDNMLENVGTQYNKGKAVLGMFETWIGPEKLRRGVLDYLKADAWGNATSRDLWAAFSKVSGQDVASAMATFLEQPGLPLVTAEPLADGKLRLRQERLHNAGVEVSQQSWKIPVALAYSDGKKTRTRTFMLDAPEKVVTLETQSQADLDQARCRCARLLPLERAGRSPPPADGETQPDAECARARRLPRQHGGAARCRRAAWRRVPEHVGAVRERPGARSHLGTRFRARQGLHRIRSGGSRRRVRGVRARDAGAGAAPIRHPTRRGGKEKP